MSRPISRAEYEQHTAIYRQQRDRLHGMHAPNWAVRPSVGRLRAREDEPPWELMAHHPQHYTSEEPPR